MKSGITILKSLVTFLCVPRVYLWTLESIFSQSGSSLLSWATRILSITSQIRATRLPFQAFLPWSGLHLPLQLCLWLLKPRVHWRPLFFGMLWWVVGVVEVGYGEDRGWGLFDLGFCLGGGLFSLCSGSIPFQFLLISSPLSGFGSNTPK